MTRSFLYQLRQRLSHFARRTPGRVRWNKPSVVRLLLETMEDRLAPANIVWASSSGGDWDDPSNWSPHQVPGPSDAATINKPNITVTHYGGDDAVAKLECSTWLDLSGGSLAVGEGEHYHPDD